MPDSNPKIEQFPLNDDAQYNFGPNSSGLRYETDHVYDCIMSGELYTVSHDIVKTGI